MSDGTDHYSDEHVDENPIPNWPPDAGIVDRTWGREEIIADIESCRGCSHEYGLCQYHQGQVDGYTKAQSDYVPAINRDTDAASVSE